MMVVGSQWKEIALCLYSATCLSCEMKCVSRVLPVSSDLVPEPQSQMEEGRNAE